MSPIYIALIIVAMAFVAALSIRSFNRATASSNVYNPNRTVLRGAQVSQVARMSLLAEGSPLPKFTAVDTDGKPVTTETLLGSPSILFFMAGAGAGCTQQSCAFRDASAELQGRNVNVVGISARNDGASFKANNALNYPIVNDADGKLQKLFGIPKTLGIIPGRVTFVSDSSGKVVKVFNAQFSFKEHIRISKETVKALEKA